jgi:bromodomain-containing factor 1
MYAYGEDWEEEEAVQVAPRPPPVNEVSFEMKRELATKITTFEGIMLEKAIEIIRNSAPDLLGVRGALLMLRDQVVYRRVQDESKEIELDIDQLDGGTLLKLYNFVVLGKGVSNTASPTSPKKQRPESLTAAGTKAQKSGRAGTGGLVRSPLPRPPSLQTALIPRTEGSSA